MLGLNKRASRVETLADRTYKVLWDDVSRLCTDLRNKARVLLVAEGVANMLPDGDNKKAAVERVNRLRVDVDDILTAYEDTRKNLETFWEKNRDRLDWCQDWTPRASDGFTVLGIAYSNFFEED